MILISQTLYTKNTRNHVGELDADRIHAMVTIHVHLHPKKPFFFLYVSNGSIITYTDPPADNVYASCNGLVGSYSV
jgi:hypothetical protein